MLIGFQVLFASSASLFASPLEWFGCSFVMRLSSMTILAVSLFCERSFTKCVCFGKEIDLHWKEDFVGWYKIYNFINMYWHNWTWSVFLVGLYSFVVQTAITVCALHRWFVWIHHQNCLQSLAILLWFPSFFSIFLYYIVKGIHSFINHLMWFTTTLIQQGKGKLVLIFYFLNILSERSQFGLRITKFSTGHCSYEYYYNLLLSLQVFTAS